MASSRLNAPRHRSLVRRSFAVVGLGALVVSLTSCKTTPDQDAFYTAPGSAPRAGDVIRSRPGVFTTDPILNSPVAGVKSFQVIYQSETATNAGTAVSGTVLVPTAAWGGGGGRPLITFGVGTRGIGDACAPSYTLSTGTDYEGSFIKTALDKGWAVAVSDMQGLGTPGQHTYEVGRSQGKALLNIARAAQRLPGTGLDANTPVGIWGYSQGGTSAGWAAELAPTYAPDLKVKGVAAGGVPADLIAVARGLDGSATMALALLAAIGFDAAYPELNLQSYLNADGKKLYEEHKNVCLVSIGGFSAIGGTAFKRMSDFTTSDPLATAAWQNRLNENKLGGGKPTVPVFQYHGASDNLVAYEQADTLHKTWCAKGVNLTWKAIPLADHVLGTALGMGDAVNFLDARFKGQPVSPSC